jgi:hypothetical protein
MLDAFARIDPDKNWRAIGYTGTVHSPRVAVQKKIRTPAGAMLTRSSWYRTWATPFPLGYEVRAEMHPWVQRLPRCEATGAPESIADEELTVDDLPEHTLADWEREAVWG